jgi:D-3-phosphoglycerate dehydrogenase / 2-oxoglutarate reductase
MRVLIADKLSNLVAGRLQDLGAEVHTEPDLSGETLTARLRALDPDVLVVRGTKVTKADVDAGRSLSLVIRGGAGVNTIDLAAASGRGVYVANCPGKNASAVAELTIGHLINLDRRIADNVAALREGKWDKKTFGASRGLRGRTLAVIGVGTIGREVIQRAKALGMHVRAWSRSLTSERAEELEVERAETPEKAVNGADAITVHLELTTETRGRIGEGVFAAMKPGAYFINTSRAEVLDTAALTRALEEKKIKVGLDVFMNEPSAGQAAFDDVFAKHPNVYGTHHIGASTLEAEDAVGDEVVRIIEAYAHGRVIPNCVNLASESDATHLLVVRHADRVGVLASVLEVLREVGHNVQEMQNIVFSGGEAACARIEIAGVPSQDTLAKINAHPAVFAASATRLED